MVAAAAKQYIGFCFCKLNNKSTKPEIIKKRETIVSALALDKTTCQDAIASKREEIKLTFLLLNKSWAKKKKETTVNVPKIAPGNLVENSLRPKNFIGISVR